MISKVLKQANQLQARAFAVATTKVQTLVQHTTPEEAAKAVALGTSLAVSAIVLDNALLAMAGSFGSGAVTTVTDPFSSSESAVCSMSKFLRGPIAMGLLFVMIAWAGYKIITGQRGGFTGAIAALAGAFVVFGAPTLSSTILGVTASC
jgi:type IV secretory pathway VirB2 component (pilin)